MSKGVRIPEALFIPTPLAYSVFADAGALIVTDSIGPDGQGTPQRTWSGATWAAAGGTATNTPTQGAELVTNGDMEGTYVAGRAPSWVTYNAPTLTEENAIVFAGSASQKIVTTVTGHGITQPTVLVAGWVLATARLYIASGSASVNYSFANGIVQTALGSWLEVVLSGRTGASYNTWVVSVIASSTFYVDSASAKPLTLSTLFSSVSVSVADVFASAAVVVTKGTQAGLVVNLDSTSSPANFVICYHDGTNVKLEKCVAGTYTTVYSGAVTYSAGAVLRVHKTGAAYRVYYNNALVTTATISDAGIVDNTLHGLFSTYASNTFDNFEVWAVGTSGEYAELDKY